MNKTIKQIAMALVPTLIMGLSSCKDKTEDNNTQPTKSLNKTSLTNNKTWYNKGGTIVQIFQSDGTFSADGEWRWVGNSDTMEIKRSSSGSFVKWKFKWNSDSEMECEWIGNGPSELYKTSRW